MGVILLLLLMTMMMVMPGAIGLRNGGRPFMARGGDRSSPVDLPDVGLLSVGAEPEPMVYELLPSSFATGDSGDGSPAGCPQAPPYSTYVAVNLKEILGARDRDRLLELTFKPYGSAGDSTGAADARLQQTLSRAGLELSVELDAKLDSAVANLLEWVTGYAGVHFVGDFATMWGFGTDVRLKYCPVTQLTTTGQTLRLPVPLVTPKTMLMAIGLEDGFGAWEHARLLVRISLDAVPADWSPPVLEVSVHDDASVRTVIERSWEQRSGRQYDPTSRFQLAHAVWLVAVVLFWTLSCVAGVVFMTGRYVLFKKYGWKGLRARDSSKFM